MRERSALPVSLAASALLFVMRLTPIFDPDYHWHLHTGRFIAAKHAIPAVDPFSHTFHGRPWKFVDWLADFFMYALHRVGGDATVLIVFSLCGAIAVALSLERTRRSVPAARSTSFAAVALLTVGAVMFRVTPRPQTLTLLLFSLLLVLLERADDRPRLLWGAPPLLVMWQNVHASAIIGWLAVLAFAVSASARRRPQERVRSAWLVAFASAAALFVALRPISRFLAGFDHVGDRRVALLFTEWAPLWSVRSFQAQVAALVALSLLALSVAALPEERNKEPLHRVLTAAGMTLLALGTMRFIPFAALALAPIALRGLDAHLSSCRTWIRWAGTFLVLGFALFFVAGQRKRLGLGLDRSLFPEESAAFIARTELQGRMYNDFHFGGYLMWTLGDRHPVFIDGRSMAVYGVDFVWEVASADDAALDGLLRRHDVTYAVAPTGKRLGWFQNRPGWSLVHFDDVAFVAVRDDAQSESVRARAYRAIHPATYWEDIDALLRDPTLVPAARAEAERAILDSPTSSLAHVTLAAVFMASRDSRADVEIAEAIRLAPTAIRGHRIKTMRCLQQADYPCACVEARVVLGLAPTNTYARRVREIIRCP